MFGHGNKETKEYEFRLTREQLDKVKDDLKRFNDETLAKMFVDYQTQTNTKIESKLKETQTLVENQNKALKNACFKSDLNKVEARAEQTITEGLKEIDDAQKKLVSELNKGEWTYREVNREAITQEVRTQLWEVQNALSTSINEKAKEIQNAILQHLPSTEKLSLEVLNKVFQKIKEIYLEEYTRLEQKAYLEIKELIGKKVVEMIAEEEKKIGEIKFALSSGLKGEQYKQKRYELDVEKQNLNKMKQVQDKI